MSLKPSLYWNLEEDKQNIREGAIELRARVAEHMYFKNYETPEKAKQQLNGPGFTWRIAAARKVELITGKKLSGRIIEVGAGNRLGYRYRISWKRITVLLYVDYRHQAFSGYRWSTWNRGADSIFFAYFRKRNLPQQLPEFSGYRQKYRASYFII
jgi:hypothetical protein